ncbi:MAG: rRNA maturation RNase YbeY [Bacteroidota bacterium]
MVRVSVFNAHRRHRRRKKDAERCVRSMLKAERITRAEISVVYIDGRYSRSINKEYRGHDASTDVLAFSLGEGETLEGEIYVNIDRARRQAREFGVSLANELGRLVIHGMLHLAGYEDRTRRGAETMRKKEDAGLVQLGLAGGDRRRQ